MRFVPRDNTALPGAYLLHVAGMLAPWKVLTEQLLEAIGLTREQLADPASRVPLETANALLVRAIEFTGEPALGLLLGTKMRISQHGYIGFAAMTARNLGEALLIAERFAPLRSTAVELRLVVEDDAAALSLVFDTELEPLRQTVLLAVAVGLLQMGRIATGKPLSGRAELALPKPSYLDRVMPSIGDNVVVFDQPANRLVFPAEYLELPLLMADPVATQLALEQCERELAALGEQAQLVGRVRRMIEASREGFPTQEQVASALHMSPRTLKRHLATQGATFSDLLDEVRREKAFLLLRNRLLNVGQVADRLGYTDVANFTRAFRRWTGMTPSAYRRD